MNRRRNKKHTNAHKKDSIMQHNVVIYHWKYGSNIDKPSVWLRCAVLYSYKPRRPEELELRKGEMVGVYGKFKEGWLRGLSLRTGKVGILPSNYISPVLRWEAVIPDCRKWETDDIWIQTVILRGQDNVSSCTYLNDSWNRNIKLRLVFGSNKLLLLYNKWHKVGTSVCTKCLISSLQNLGQTPGDQSS